MPHEVQEQSHQSGKAVEHLQELAAKMGFACIPMKELNHTLEIKAAMQRARKVIDALDINNDSLDETINSVREFAKLAYMINDCKLAEHLEESKKKDEKIRKLADTIKYATNHIRKEEVLREILRRQKEAL